MMLSLGHNVYHYGVGCDIECSENIDIMSPEIMDWSGTASYWPRYNTKIISEINKRKNHGDFVCVINGILNQSLETISDVQVVEYAIGYLGTFAKFRVFASYAHMHHVWGAQGGFDPDGRFYDTVIPHYLDADQYKLNLHPSDYYLYIGRLTPRKGIQIAVDTCERLGVRLVIAGPGEQIYKGKNIEYVGDVTGSHRLALYMNAIATFAPTQYIEPFGMTVIEAQMCGTPVITTDWGAFTETVRNNFSGFRCRTLDQFVFAVKNVKNLDRSKIRHVAVETWGLNSIRNKYQTYFNTLTDLWGAGWYTLHQAI